MTARAALWQLARERQHWGEPDFDGALTRAVEALLAARRGMNGA